MPGDSSSNAPEADPSADLVSHNNRARGRQFSAIGSAKSLSSAHSRKRSQRNSALSDAPFAYSAAYSRKPGNAPEGLLPEDPKQSRPSQCGEAEPIGKRAPFDEFGERRSQAVRPPRSSAFGFRLLARLGAERDFRLTKMIRFVHEASIR